MSIAGFVILLAAVLWLAWSNGANDNFKGVATLYGSGTCSFRAALAWATVATVLGSLVSVLFAATLVEAFSGKGLVPDGLVDGTLLTAVGLAGAVTIFLATVLGMPTSTTHALTGALVGAALAADPEGVGWGTLATKFAQPLILSPVLAVGLTSVLYVGLRRARRATGIEARTCACVGAGKPQPVLLTSGGMALVARPGAPQLRIVVGTANQCVERSTGRLLGVDAQQAVDWLHYLSGASVCFARAVNDTPKIAALLLAVSVVSLPGHSSALELGLVALAMAAGGLLQSRRVAETMGKRITDLDTGQGLTANLVTALLVLGASHLGVPVSTTHVACGSIFGIGLVSGQARWSTIRRIAITWITTLPVGFALGAGSYLALSSLGG